MGGSACHNHTSEPRWISEWVTHVELLPPEPKLTQLFLGLPTHPSDPPEPVLRVSLYREEEEVVTTDGSTRLVGQHARFSVWRDDRPTCAMSLGEDEARRLSSFIRDGLRQDQPESHRTDA